MTVIHSYHHSICQFITTVIQEDLLYDPRMKLLNDIELAAVSVESVGHVTRKSVVLRVRYPVWQHTFVSPSAD